MGTSPPVYSSVSGPAKWAAVVILTAACSAGLTYSLVAKQPRAAQAAPPPVKELPPRKAHISPPPVQPIESQPIASTPAPAAAIPSSPTHAAQPRQASTQTPPTPASTSVEPSPPVIEPPTPAHKLNLNNAPASTLELLPGIGPAMAERIVSYRTLHGPFRSIKDLDKVKGIGPKTLEKLAPLITVD